MFKIFAQQTKQVDPLKNLIINEMAKSIPWLNAAKEEREEREERNAFEDLLNRAFIRRDITASPYAGILAKTTDDLNEIFELRKMAYYADRYEKKRKQQYQPTYDFLLDGVPVKVYKDHIQYGYKMIPYTVRETVSIVTIVLIIRTYRF